MRPLVAVFSIFLGAEAHASTCPTVVPSNDPATVLPSSWVNVISSGSYATTRADDNVYWQVIVEHPIGIGCADQSLNSGPHTKRYCATLTTDDLATPNVDERELRVVYGDTFPLSCPVGYAIDSGQCVLIGECPAEPEIEPSVCADGYPPEAAIDLGYPVPTCDRPALTQCSDQSYVRADTGICPTVCTDFQTCYDVAFGNSSCDGAENFEFEYTDPQNWSFSCTTIIATSPDHPVNGGNGDGNPFNDPATPTSGEGSTPSVGDSDPITVVTAIGDELEDDLANIERAIRQGIEQSKINTETIEVAINRVENLNATGFSGVEDPVRDGITSSEGSAEGIRQSVDTLGSKLDVVVGQLADDSPCDPTQPGYLACLDTPLSNLPEHSTTSVATFADANNAFKMRLDNSPIVAAMTDFSGVLTLDNPQCPPFEIAFPEPIGQTLSTSLHCDLWTTITPLISVVMILVYSIIGFRIFASA